MALNRLIYSESSRNHFSGVCVCVYGIGQAQNWLSVCKPQEYTYFLFMFCWLIKQWSWTLTSVQMQMQVFSWHCHRNALFTTASVLVHLFDSSFIVCKPHTILQCVNKYTTDNSIQLDPWSVVCWYDRSGSVNWHTSVTKIQRLWPQHQITAKVLRTFWQGFLKVI